MKISKLFWKGALAFMLVIPLACEKNDDGEYVPPVTSYETLKGSWKMNKITQYDEIAIAAGTKPTEMNLTSKFNFASFTLILNADSGEVYIPTSYKVEGNAPALFPKEGFWELDYTFLRSDNKTTKLRLYSDAAKTKLTDELLLITLPSDKRVLDLKLVRSSNGLPYVSYLYSLK